MGVTNKLMPLLKRESLPEKRVTDFGFSFHFQASKSRADLG